ncbi:HAUS augmin-like complex subunit 2 [Liolophura sinensis]|uniref:HAUS augmin-like complex subunit 2 n=1 Tax=Liolophura sinensis TaxID=3198878 RepID=UPI00315827DD
MQMSILSSIGIDVDESHNPWDNTISRSMTNALLLAEKTGHLRRTDHECADMMKETKEKLPSLKLISLLREITTKRREHNKVLLEVQKFVDDKETRDITQLDMLEVKVKEINELNNYLQNIISGKEFLLNRLQQPYIGEFLKLEANYHMFASELFPQVSTMLADLTTNIDTVDWAASADLDHYKFDSVLDHLTKCVAKMQTHFQTLCRLRDALNQVYKQRETTGS